MGKFKDLYESLRTVRTSGYTPDKAMQVDDNIPVIGTDLSDSEVVQFINKVKDLSSKRDAKLKDYEYMSKDGIIGGAIELLADETTICDETMGLPFWVESENKEFEEFFNNWLKHTVHLHKKAWTYAFRIIRDGDISLRTYNSSLDSNSVDKMVKECLTIGDYFELVDKSNDVIELNLCDKTIGYQFLDKDYINNDKILSKDEFIHIYRDTGEREKVLVQYKDDKGNIRDTKFKVPYGTSYLDSSRQAFLILDLLDTMVLSQRINKNQIIRIMGVEVGNAGKVETTKMINEVKTAFRTSSMEKDKAYKEGNKTSTIANIYVPTRQGKGSINVDEVGGNVDVKDLTDLDYYTNKLFASLRTPKEFLGFSEGGFFSEGSMTKKDIRFARMVRSVKSLLADLTYEMVEFKKTKTKWNTKDIEFSIKSVPVPSTEDIEIIDSLNNSMNVSVLLKDFLAGNPRVSEDELVTYMLKNILKLPKYSEFYHDNPDVPEDEQIKSDDIGGGFSE